MKVSSEFGKSIIDNYREPSRNVSHQDRYYYLDDSLVIRKEIS